MTIEEALYAYLTSQAGVAALVQTRLYPETAPTSAALPYCIYTQRADDPQYHMQGPAGITQSHITLDVFAVTAAERAAVSRALHVAVDAWRWTRPAMNGLAVRYAGIDNAEDGYISPSEGSEQGTYQRSLDVRLWYILA